MLLVLWIIFHVAAGSQSPSRPKALTARDYEQLAQQSAAQQDWPDAIDEFRRAIEVAPKNPKLRNELAAALATSHDFTGAIAAYQDVLRLDARDETAEVGLAVCYRQVHNYGEARKLLLRAAQEHPASAAPQLALGNLDIELQRYDDAIESLQRAVHISPANNDAHNDLAAAFHAKGELPEALAQLEIVLARDPKNILAHYIRAEIYADQNDTAHALPEAQEVVDQQSDRPRGRVLLGKILLRVPDCARAVEILRPLESLNPADPETLFLLQRAFQCAGDSAAAQRVMSEFETASKSDRATKENVTQAGHLVEQANDRALHNDFQGALDLLQQALEKDPDNGSAYSQLAKLYYSAGQIDKADEAALRALAIRPSHPDYLYVYGKILEREGKLDDAIHAFEQSTLVNPKEADAYFEIGAIRQHQGDLKQARAAFQKALDLVPDDPDYRRALDSVPPTGPPATR